MPNEQQYAGEKQSFDHESSSVTKNRARFTRVLDLMHKSVLVPLSIMRDYRTIRILTLFFVFVVIITHEFHTEAPEKILLSTMAAILIFIWDQLAVTTFKPAMIVDSPSFRCEHALLDDIKPRIFGTYSVKIVHYTADNIHTLLHQLCELKHIKTINILLKSPEGIIDEKQRAKIVSNHLSLNSGEFDPEKVIVKYYSEPGSIRGIFVEGVGICLGWYTYQTNDSQSVEIWGHNNPSIYANTKSQYYFTLSDFFNNHWEKLNKNAQSGSEIKFPSFPERPQTPS